MINKKTSPGNFEFAELFAVVNKFVKQNSLPLIIQKADNRVRWCVKAALLHFLILQ